MPIGEFFFDGVLIMKSAKGSRSELTTPEVSHECDIFCCKNSICMLLPKNPSVGPKDYCADFA